MFVSNITAGYEIASCMPCIKRGRLSDSDTVKFAQMDVVSQMQVLCRLKRAHAPAAVKHSLQDTDTVLTSLCTLWLVQ